MKKKNVKKRVRISDFEFGQPIQFIKATGYMPNRNRLDIQAVSLHVSPETNRNYRSQESHGWQQ